MSATSDKTIGKRRVVTQMKSVMIIIYPAELPFALIKVNGDH
ncbi:hypothetical protein [Thalassospira lucentensis]